MGEQIKLAELISNMKNQIATDHVVIQTLYNLLIEKGLITNEEFQMMFEETHALESDPIHDYLEGKAKGENDA